MNAPLTPQQAANALLRRRTIRTDFGAWWRAIFYPQSVDM